MSLADQSHLLKARQVPRLDPFPVGCRTNCHRSSHPGNGRALLERAPLDIRVNIARVARDEVLSQFEGSVPTPLSPWGIRLASETRLDDHPAFADGLIEVQDEGSQLHRARLRSKAG